MALSGLRSLPIRLRLALGYALFLIAVIAAIGVFLLTALENSLQREADSALRLRALRVQREITTGEDGRLDPGDVTAALLDLAPLEEFAAPGIYVQILNHDGLVLASSPNLPGGQLPATSEVIADALSGREAYANVPAGSDRVRVYARPIEGEGRTAGIVLVGESLHLLDVTLRRMQQLLVLAALSAALVSVVGGWWLTTRALGPVAAVSQVAQRIAATGQFEQRIAVPPAQDEVGELVATFNVMLDRLERTFRRQREFLADVSHELRGPLMVIRGNLDLLKLGLPDDQRQESARDATEEVERMARLVSDLLFLAEADAQEMVQRQPVSLDEVVRTAWERAQAVDAGAHEVVLAGSDGVEVLGDRDRLEQLLWNLVENALRYTPAGGQVVLSLRRRGEVAEVKVADSGIGIPPEHQSRIFERFYRIDRARSHGHGSTGLGLAIAKQVAEMHGGQVQVSSKPGEGSVFTVVLPIQESESPPAATR